MPGIWPRSIHDTSQDSYNWQTCLVCLQILHLRHLWRHWRALGLEWSPVEPHLWQITSLMSSHSLSPIVPNPWASCCVCDDVFMQLCVGHFVQDTVKDSTDDYWNPKWWLHQLSSPDQWGGESCHEWVSEGLSPHERMLAVNDDCVVLQVFFNNSQNNLCNFARHWGETDRRFLPGSFLLPFLKTVMLASFQSSGTFYDSMFLCLCGDGNIYRSCAAVIL